MQAQAGGDAAAKQLRRRQAGEVASCLLAWVSLMDGGDAAENLAEWKRLAEYGGIALLFADLAGRRETWKPLLEDWNMPESQVVKEWIAMGEERGRRETLRSTLIHALKIRFGPLPTDLVTSIHSENDLDRLSRWFDAALTCPSLEQFQAGLQSEG